MRKIPSLFKRDYEGNRQVFNEVVEGCEWVLNGEGIPTEKIDGTCCMVRAGVLYKRYERKPNKPVPDGFIPAQDADPITGEQPGWLKVTDDPADRWHREAYEYMGGFLADGTYELIGARIGNKGAGNPYHLDHHELWKHGERLIDGNPRTFDEIKQWLSEHDVEGIVWHHPDGRMCKIKRRDFGLKWG